MGYLTFIAPLAAGLALVLAYGLSAWINKSGAGAKGMKEITGRIRTGAKAFYKREYPAMAVVIALLSAAIWLLINQWTAVLYAVGALFSVFSCFFGTKVIAKGNARAANAATESGINKSLKVTFRSGAVMGLCASGYGLLGVSIVVAVFGATSAAEIECGFALGASSVSLLMCTGGGIFTRAGVYGSDIFESYVGAMTSVIVLAVLIPGAAPRFGAGFDLDSAIGSLFPLLIASFGLIASMITIMFVRGRENTSPVATLKTGIYVSSIIVVICSILLSKAFFGGYNCAIAVSAGVLAGVVIGKITESYASRAADGGVKTGMDSTVWFIIFIAATVLTADAFAGVYGIAVAAIGMLSTTGMTLATGAFGHVTETAGGIDEKGALPQAARQIIDKLEIAGKTAAANGRGFATGSAVLTSIALFLVYSQVAGLRNVNLISPVVIAGLFIGAMLPFKFASMAMKSVEKTALGEMLLRCLFALAAPFTVGMLMGARALGGMLAGSVAAGALIAIMMGNTDSGLYKDKVGPSVNILIKFMVIVSVVFSGIFIKTGGLLFS